MSKETPGGGQVCSPLAPPTLCTVSQKRGTLLILVFYVGLVPVTRITRISFIFIFFNPICSGRTKIKVWLSLMLFTFLMIISDPDLEHVLNDVQRSP